MEAQADLKSNIPHRGPCCCWWEGGVSQWSYKQRWGAANSAMADAETR
jgi:hypothetical protein